MVKKFLLKKGSYNSSLRIFCNLFCSPFRSDSSTVLRAVSGPITSARDFCQF